MKTKTQLIPTGRPELSTLENDISKLRKACKQIRKEITVRILMCVCV